MSLKISFLLEELQKHNFQKLAKHSAHPREKIRLLAFAHLKDGKSVQEAAKVVKTCRNALYICKKL